jgi:hypothetical protein
MKLVRLRMRDLTPKYEPNRHEFFLRLPSIMPSGSAHPPYQKHVLFLFVLWGQKCCNETAAQIQKESAYQQEFHPIQIQRGLP